MRHTERLSDIGSYILQCCFWEKEEKLIHFFIINEWTSETIEDQQEYRQ